jgi:hypothetical protein
MTDQLPVYTLVREASSDNGTLGEIFNPDGSHLCYTCELPWQNNSPDVSCIPLSTYTCIPHDSAAHPNVWELQNVPGRSAILIHNGNTEHDSLGCIVVGSQQGTLGGLPAVLNSNNTLAMLGQTLPPTFTLTITGPDPS